jgi:hypothetical protein
VRASHTHCSGEQSIIHNNSEGGIQNENSDSASISGHEDAEKAPTKCSWARRGLRLPSRIFPSDCDDPSIIIIIVAVLIAATADVGAAGSGGVDAGVLSLLCWERKR